MVVPIDTCPSLCIRHNVTKSRSPFFYLSVKMSLVYRGCDLERASNSMNLSLNSIESNDEKY